MTPWIQLFYGIIIIFLGVVGYAFESSVRGKYLTWDEIESYPKFRIFTAISIGLIVVLTALHRIFL